MKTMTEGQLVSGCLKDLKLMGIPAWRNNSGATKIGDRFVRFGFPGSSDILGIWPATGQLIAIECKVGQNSLTKKQKMFLEAIRDSKGIAIVARTIEGMHDALFDTDPLKGG